MSTESNPLKRNISADRQIKILNDTKEKYLQYKQEKMIELERIESDISQIDAQIANIMMKKSRRKKLYEQR
ncbi:MAG: hypothetical protein MSH60_10225 [Ruminococcus sp.]|nr:hypothetical protein [Ruminococcus sp.]